MFIEPKKYKGYEKLIHQMLKQYQRHYGISVKQNELKDAIFMIAYNKYHHGIIGGGWLSQKKIDPQQLTLEQKYLPDSVETYWECSGINFSLDETAPAYFVPSTLYSLKRNFYEELYESLINFGIAKNTNFVMLRNYPDEHENIKLFGSWPFKNEFASSESPTMVYGVVPVTLASQSFYQEQYELRTRDMGWMSTLNNELI